MWSLTRTQRTPIAIDVQSNEIVCAQLVRRGSDWVPSAMLRMRRPQTPARANTACTLSDDELRTLGDALGRQGAIGRDVVLVAPAGATCTQLLELPPRMPETPMDALARAEVARLSRWNEAIAFQMVTWDVPPPAARAGTSGDTLRPTTLGAAAIPEAALEPIIAQLATIDLRVIAVLPAAPAAAVVAAHGQADADAGGSIVLDIAWDRSSLTITRNGAALYQRELEDNGLSLLLRGLVADLHMSSDDATSAIELETIGLDGRSPRAQRLCEGFLDALAVEVEATVAFATRRYSDLSPRRLHVLGAGDRVKGLADALRARLDLHSPESQTTPVGETPAEITWTLTDGAAVCPRAGTMGVGPLPASQRAKLQRDGLVRGWSIAVAGIAAACACAVITLQIITGGSIAPQEARLAALNAQQRNLDTDLAASNRRLAVHRATISFYERLDHQPDHSAMLRIIGRTVTPSTTLTELTIAAPNASPGDAAGLASTVVRKFRLSGSASDATALAEQVSALRQIDIFDHVELARTSRGADGAGVRFELTFDLVAPRARKAGAP